jgi:feruloyl esterase
MASAMLATYPDVFAAGAIIAGLPYGSARNVQEAFQAMAKGSDRSARTWGDLVREASSHGGTWPKISVWHGMADAIVHPGNMEDALKQWSDVHGVGVRPRIEHTIEGHRRRVWRTEADEDVIEAVSITGMGHGVPLASRGVERCGNAGPFHFDVDISSSHHILRFWGLAGSSVAAEREAAMLARPPVPTEAESSEIPALAARESASSGKERDESSPGGWRRHDPRPVIEAALKAAGLLSEAGAQAGARNPLDPRQIITGTLRSVGLLKN